MSATVVSLFTGEVLAEGTSAEAPASPLRHDGRYRPGQVFSFLFNQLNRSPAEVERQLSGFVLGELASQEEAAAALTLLQLAWAQIRMVNEGGDHGDAA